MINKSIYDVFTVRFMICTCINGILLKLCSYTCAQKRPMDGKSLQVAILHPNKQIGIMQRSLNQSTKQAGPHLFPTRSRSRSRSKKQNGDWHLLAQHVMFDVIRRKLDDGRRRGGLRVGGKSACRGSWHGWLGHHTPGSIVMGLLRTVAAMSHWRVVVIADMNFSWVSMHHARPGTDVEERENKKPRTAEKTGIDVTMTPQKKCAVHGFGQDVQNAVKDRFRIRRNHISPLGESPGDGVQEPQEDQVNADGGVRLGDFWTQGARMLAPTDRDDICDPEQCQATKDKIAPLKPLVNIRLHFAEWRFNTL